MTRSSAISSLEYGIALCDITKTLLVHIPIEEAKGILKVLETRRLSAAAIAFIGSLNASKKAIRPAIAATITRRARISRPI